MSREAGQYRVGGTSHKMSDIDNGSLLWAARGVKYATVLADPAWPSKKRKANGQHWLTDHTKPKYMTMSMKDILDLPVSDIAADDAVLVMWTTWMHLPLALQVIPAWGFTYCTGMPWLKVCKDSTKPIYGPGVWFQHCTELVLIARRGSPFGKQGNPRPARKGIIIAPRQEHSRKPEDLQNWVDAKFPGPKIELFARRTRPGWTSWGNEVDAS